MARTRKGTAPAEPTATSSNTSTRGRKRANPPDEDALPPTKTKRARAAAPKEEDEDVHKDDAQNKDDEPKPSKPAKGARAKGPAKAKDTGMPLAARTAQTAHRIGAHVSAAGGVHMAVPNAVQLGSNAFALFLKSQRKWSNPDLREEHALAFADACSTHSYDAPSHVVPHGSYLVNLANPDKEKATQAYDSFLDDLKRCSRLGISLYNFHPGNTNGEPRPEAIARLAAQLNRAHRETPPAGSAPVITLLENMAAAPTANTIGGRFEDLRDTIALIEDKKRVGVCLDTCHTFAAGYDLRSPEAFKATMSEFDEVVGMKYLRAWHFNDSKGVLGSHRDLHQNIGVGFLGLRAFHNIMNDSRFHGMPMILETPIDKKGEDGKTVEDKGVWAKEIKLLESLVGMDADSDDFKQLEADLASQGSAERTKMQEQFDKKQSEVKKPKAARGKKRGAKKSDSDEDSDE